MGMKTFKSVPYCHQGTKVSVSSGPSNNQRNERGLWCGCSLDYLVLALLSDYLFSWTESPSVAPYLAEFALETELPVLHHPPVDALLLVILTVVVVSSCSSCLFCEFFHLCSIEIIDIIFGSISGAVTHHQLSAHCLHVISSLVGLFIYSKRICINVGEIDPRNKNGANQIAFALVFRHVPHILPVNLNKTHAIIRRCHWSFRASSIYRAFRIMYST